MTRRPKGHSEPCLLAKASSLINKLNRIYVGYYSNSQNSRANFFEISHKNKTAKHDVSEQIKITRVDVGENDKR